MNIDGWVWAEDGWKNYSTTHTIRGRTATVVAEPQELVFWPGDDGPPTRCAGAGVRWFGGQSSDAPGRCAHKYFKNTPEATELPAGVTITYRLRWFADDGQGVMGTRPGPLASLPINVDQIISTAEPVRRP